VQNIIISKNNDKINFLSRLAQKKYRDRFGKFLVENLVTIYDALKDGQEPETVYITSDLLKSKHEKVNYIITNFSNYFVIDEKINKCFSSLDTPSGICAVYKKNSGMLDFKKSIVYLNGISDPGNLGTILRTTLAFGIKNVVTDNRCVDIYNPKTINASKDSIFKLNLLEDANLKLLTKIKNAMNVISTSITQGEDVCDVKVKAPFCLVLGSESHGVSPEIAKLADQYLTIKMSSSMESLNVAVATGILLYNLKS
jgi:RNA methyltransferase, TrmH family